MGNSDVQVWLEPLCVPADVDTTTSHTQARVRESFQSPGPQFFIIWLFVNWYVAVVDIAMQRRCTVASHLTGTSRWSNLTGNLLSSVYV